MFRLRRWLTPLLGFAYGVLLLRVFLATLARGLWEDGYFAKRFAYNLWHHGSFSWNPADGPVYGMTSQTLALLAAALYPLAPAHFVLTLKVLLFAALAATFFLLASLSADTARVRATDTPAPERSALRVLVCTVGLACPLLPEVALSGLETPLALAAVASSLVAQRAFQRGGRPSLLVLALLGLYVTRPDALVIPLTLLLGSWLAQRGGASTRTPSGREPWRVLALTGLGLATLLVCFRLYYGSALPLPFYVKVRGLSVQTADHLAVFEPEKLQNVTQIAFFAAPFVFIALHSRSREVRLYLVSALVFAAYHFFATIETMGQLSRFYLPALVPIIAAAAHGYGTFLGRRRVATLLAFCCVYLFAFSKLTGGGSVHFSLAPAYELPFLLEVGVLLFLPNAAPTVSICVAAALLMLGSFRNYPLAGLAFAKDENILLAQIRPRVTFRELERVRATLHPRVVFHTDVGAPGLLFPEARVTDIDGLLNPDIALRGVSVETLCRRERPEAFYVPNKTYPELRARILGGECIKQYERVVPVDRYAQLYVRRDVLPLYGEPSEPLGP